MLCTKSTMNQCSGLACILAGENAADDGGGYLRRVELFGAVDTHVTVLLSIIIND